MTTAAEIAEDTVCEYKPKEAFEERQVNEWRKGGEVQEGGDVNKAVSGKVNILTS